MPQLLQRRAGAAFLCIGINDLESVQLGGSHLVMLYHGTALKRVLLDAELHRLSGATPLARLAQRLGLARGTVQSRLERMTASGALRPNSSRVLPAALGRGVAASVSAELDQSHLNEAIAALREIPEVLECHAPAGDTDLLIRVVATSPDDLYRVSEEIRLCPGIVRTSTSMFLREVIPYRTTGLLKD